MEPNFQIEFFSSMSVFFNDSQLMVLTRTTCLYCVLTYEMLCLIVIVTLEGETGNIYHQWPCPSRSSRTASWAVLSLEAQNPAPDLNTRGRLADSCIKWLSSCQHKLQPLLLVSWPREKQATDLFWVFFYTIICTKWTRHQMACQFTCLDI